MDTGRDHPDCVIGEETKHVLYAQFQIFSSETDLTCSKYRENPFTLRGSNVLIFLTIIIIGGLNYKHILIVCARSRLLNYIFKRQGSSDLFSLLLPLVFDGNPWV